jgi:hypothetical protein
MTVPPERFVRPSTHGVYPSRFNLGEHNRRAPPQKKRKAGVVESPEVFDPAGLLVNEPPGRTGLPLI